MRTRRHHRHAPGHGREVRLRLPERLHTRSASASDRVVITLADLSASFDDAPEPWDQQPGENDHQYQRFLQYRNMPPIRRSLRNMQADLNAQRDARPGSHRYLANLSSAHDWPYRAAAWDRHEHDLLVEANRQDIIEMRARHAQIAYDALDKVAERLTNIDASTMTVRDMMFMFDLAVKVERMSRGDTTSSVAVSASEPRLTPRPERTMEELTVILETLREAGVTEFNSTTDVTVEIDEFIAHAASP